MDPHVELFRGLKSHNQLKTLMGEENHRLAVVGSCQRSLFLNWSELSIQMSRDGSWSNPVANVIP